MNLYLCLIQAGFICIQVINLDVIALYCIPNPPSQSRDYRDGDIVEDNYEYNDSSSDEYYEDEYYEDYYGDEVDPFGRVKLVRNSLLAYQNKTKHIMYSICRNYINDIFFKKK